MPTPSTVKLTREEWVDLVTQVVSSIGVNKARFVLVNALGQEKADDLIERKEGKALTKQENARIIRGLYDVVPGKNREAKIKWAMDIGRKVFKSDDRFIEVLEYSQSRVGDYENTPVEPTQPIEEVKWRTGLANLKATNGKITFWTRNIQKATGDGRNQDGGFEWIISRITGEGFGRLLIMVMGGNRSPSRIFFDGSFENNKFKVPMTNEAKWDIEANNGSISIKLDGKVIWKASGNFTVTGAVMKGYPKRGFLGEWRA